MASKRPGDGFIPNPLVKKRNLGWTLEIPSPGDEQVPSPPADQGGGMEAVGHVPPDRPSSRAKLNSAAVESGHEKTDDHLSRFAALLSSRTLPLPFPSPTPSSTRSAHLDVNAYKRLYESNAGSDEGAHFVVHQHDHPIAGTHYDLRLQINGGSSASWAVMYGLPGDANSVRGSRNATETRVHCLWNHLVETASPSTGSLLIWDTGTYTILPRRSKHAPAIDPDSPAAGESDSDSDLGAAAKGPKTEQQKLEDAFRNRKIRVRLDGRKLPRGYTINLRLTKREDALGREVEERKRERERKEGVVRRRRRGGRGTGRKDPVMTSESDSNSVDSEAGETGWEEGVVVDTHEGHELERATTAKERGETAFKERRYEVDGLGEAGKIKEPDKTRRPNKSTNDALTEAERREVEEAESELVRATNAYPGAENTIGSVHQRRWYLSLDRVASELEKRRVGRATRWVRAARDVEGLDGDGGGDGGGDVNGRLEFPFYVRGPEFERSVVTGRLAREVLRDEGVEGFVGRKGWKPVLK